MDECLWHTLKARFAEILIADIDALIFSFCMGDISCNWETVPRFVYVKNCLGPTI